MFSKYSKYITSVYLAAWTSILQQTLHMMLYDLYAVKKKLNCFTIFMCASWCIHILCYAQ